MKLFLRLFLISIFAFGVLALKNDRSYAQSQYSSILTKMEKSLFEMDYNSQNDDSRLDRIENVVYGTASSKPTLQRIDKLKKDLSAELIGQEIKPKADTFAEDEDGYKEDIPKADSNINYPIVNRLEQEVFKKEFRTLDINKRLSSLEQKTFNKTYSDDLSTRVDRLNTAIIHEDIVAEDSSRDMYEDNLPPQNNRDSYDYNSQNSVLDGYKGYSDTKIPLAALEKSVLKQSFPDDTVKKRLARLEASMFNSNFGNDNEETRLERVASAYQAKKSSKKYDTNKTSQHLSTAMQVGTLLLMVLAFVL